MYNVFEATAYGGVVLDADFYISRRHQRALWGRLLTGFIRSGAFIWVLCYLSCGGATSLLEEQHSDQFMPFQRASDTAIIIVGQIISNRAIGSPYPSHWDENYIVQLYKVDVKVENVLRGPSFTGNIDIYYFSFFGLMGSPARLRMAENGGTWHVGDREIFFLRRDSGVLRTTCDFLQYCVIPVRTGAHPKFKLDPSKPINDSIIDFLLTRGIGASDGDMIQAIEKTPGDNFSKEYWIQKLQQLAAQETPPVRQAACKVLAVWNRNCHSFS